VSRRRAAVALAAVVITWGLTWPVNKVILQSLPPLWSVALRSAIAAAVLFGMTAARGQLALPRRGDWPVVLSIALLHMVGFSVLMAIGLTSVSTGRSVVLAYTTPLWVTPGARLFLRERVTARRGIGVTLGLLGLAVLFNPLAFDWSRREAVLGNAALVVAALLWAASILHIRGHRWRGTPFQLVPWETLLAAAVLAPAALAVDGLPAAHWDVTLVLMLLYAAVPGTALAYWAVAVASRHLPAVTVSLGLLGVPIVSILTATLALGEALTPSLLAAMALVIGGVAIGATGGSPPGR
jgi:drug/metabolite transporter (DMT)-like permease